MVNICLVIANNSYNVVIFNLFLILHYILYIRTVFTECETSYKGLVRGRDAVACVPIQLGVALESLKPTRMCVCVCVCMLFFCVRTAKFGCKLAILKRIG